MRLLMLLAVLFVLGFGSYEYHLYLREQEYDKCVEEHLEEGFWLRDPCEEILD